MKKLSELRLGEIDPHAAVFNCPCCDAKLQFKLRVNVLGVYELNEDDAPILYKEEPKRDLLAPSERELIESLRPTGVLQAFEAAVKADPVSNAKDIESYFITFLKRAVPKKSPQFAIRLCLPENEAAGDLEMWQLNRTIAVIADGQIRTFIPSLLVSGEPLKALSGGNGTVKSKDSFSDVNSWVRTRYGYVAGKGALFSELRRRAIGDFANTGI